MNKLTFSFNPLPPSRLNILQVFTALAFKKKIDEEKGLHCNVLYLHKKRGQSVLIRGVNWSVYSGVLKLNISTKKTRLQIKHSRIWVESCLCFEFRSRLVMWDFPYKRRSLFINTFVYLRMCQKAGFSVTFVWVSGAFPWAPSSAALIISHFEAVTHFCQSFACFRGIVISASSEFALIRFGKTKNKVEGFFMLFVNIKSERKHYI